MATSPQNVEQPDGSPRVPAKGTRLRSVGNGTLSIKLPDEAARVVRELADSKGITATEVLRRGIALERFVTAQLDAGGTFLVQRPDGRLETVHFVFA